MNVLENRLQDPVVGASHSRSSKILPVSAVIPTLNRADALRRTLGSLTCQGVLPAELIIIDGSNNDSTRTVVDEWSVGIEPKCKVVWQRATQLGAACQRNQGVASATQPFVWFFDDDILFEPDCVERLWKAIENDEALGGVNVMITNQQYTTPGRVSRTLFQLLDGNNRTSYAGKCIGPAFNLLPEDDSALPSVVPVDWLNTTCTLYRREALPEPPFDSHFVDYSMMEDLALSLVVGRKWSLANARTARIFHDSQPATYKAHAGVLAEMELVNRHYIMTEILGKRRASDYLRLSLWEVFQLVSSAAGRKSRQVFWATCRGKLGATRRIIGASGSSHGSPAFEKHLV